MNCKNLLSAILLAGSLTSFAQSNLLNAKTPDEIGKKTAAQLNSDNDKPLPYGYVHDRDIMMGKAVWEIIDLDERINFPLYYPVDTANIGKDRRSLFDVLIKNIKEGKITEVYADPYFNTKRSLGDLESTFKFRDTTDAGKDLLNSDPESYRGRHVAAQPEKKNKKGKVIQAATPAQDLPASKTLSAEYIDERFLTSQDISGYKIKGYWYFDKRQGEMKYRLLGLCPVAPEAKEVGAENPDVIELFWIYFPAARDVLHGANAFNDRNSAMPISFDHLLNSRRFNSVIYEEENVYGDRLIDQYIKDNAQLQLLESERVKEKIRNFEQDMWNY
ncbi:gliding motility protein GldN [Flavobacterium sp. 3HN19-14]|uniref:type IX secretion system ring protein PorN/GldN n=1 Tax=Flavobacterium sp. 3HN19-14 TaxID=3448133 RepID=UPI003EE23366